MSLHQTQIAATDIFVPQAKTQRAADRPSDRLFAHELSQQSANQTKTQEPRISKRSDSNGVTTDRGAVNAGSARRSIEEDKIGARVIDSEFENGAQKILNSEQVNIATGVPTELWLDSPAITQLETTLSNNSSLVGSLVALGGTGDALGSVANDGSVSLTDEVATDKNAAAFENQTKDFFSSRVEQVGSFNTAHDQGRISPEQTKLTAQIQNGALRPSVLTEAVDPSALSREWALVGEQFEEVSTRDSRLDNTVFLAAEMTAGETADTKTLLQALNSSSPRVTAALNAQRGSTRLAEQEVELAPHDDATDSEQSKVTSAKTESQATAAHGAANQRNPLAATQSLMAQIAGGQTEGETGAHDPSANGAGEFLRTLNSATLHERTERAAAPNQIAQLEIPKGIAQLASGQVKTLTLKISPASLGEAKLSVSLVRDRIHGSLIVESHAAKSAIEGQLHKLVDRLAHEGLTLDSLDVEVGADQWSEDRASQWRQRAETPRTRFSLEDIEQEISGGAVAPEQGRLGARNVISAAGVDALV